MDRGSLLKSYHYLSTFGKYKVYVFVKFSIGLSCIYGTKSSASHIHDAHIVYNRAGFNVHFVFRSFNLKFKIILIK